MLERSLACGIFPDDLAVEMTGAQVNVLRRSMCLSPASFADLCGVHEATVYRWEGFDRKPVLMVETTRRVLAVLASRPVNYRVRLAEVAKKHGWQAAWQLLFDDAPPLKARRKA